MNQSLVAIEIEPQFDFRSLHPAGLPVLAIEDEDDHFALLDLQLAEERPRIRLERARNLADARTVYSDQQPEAVLLDLELPDSKGLATLSQARRLFEDVPVIVLSAHNDTQLGLDAIQNGAADFVDKSSLCTAGLARRILYSRERFDAQRELRRRSDLMRTLVAILGHDLKTPPRQIGVLCGLIETALEPDARAIVSDHLTAVRKRCAHLKTLLDQTMSYASNAAKQPTKSITTVGDIVDQVRSDLEPGQWARVALARDAALFVDPSLMFHVFRNVIENGLTYWRDQPSRVTIDAVSSQQNTVVTIRDTGMGLASDLCDRVFEPTVRGVSRDQFPGTGFGLSIVRLLVEAHGGKATLASAPGDGTTVTLTLPLAPTDTERRGF